MEKKVLITGFEAYGGRSLNPSARLAAALDGACIGSCTVIGRSLPVTFTGLAERIEAHLDSVQPSLVIALGLAPGEAMIRLERFGVNLADFEIPDNVGTQLEDSPITSAGATALAATLPLRAIEKALLADGIPARLSGTAGTFLCNATLYGFLHAIEQRGDRIPCGFIHLPYLPEQVAETLRDARKGTLEFHQRADIASMDFTTMERALRIAITVAVSAAP